MEKSEFASRRKQQHAASPLWLTVHQRMVGIQTVMHNVCTHSAVIYLRDVSH
ncbi:hypothetical protein JOB18_005572 [Solea senegalensis]|nr:hypothetical protein JOB18_005572 [Solea senegalensis]